ncbi:MAG: SRPBCC domain-containing protein [Balneolaceae bacterium]
MTMITEKTNVETKDRELIITRDFDAPSSLMFEVWTDCKHLKHWWGPSSWPMKECSLDFKEGGVWHFCLRGPNEGDESWGKAIYQEIDKPKKIVYTDHFSDKDGNINEEMPSMLIAVEFHDYKGKARVVSTTLFDTPETREKVVEMGAVEGMSDSMGRLDEYLAQITNN